MRALKSRLIIDTNLWISFLLTKDFTKLDLIMTSSLVKLIFSEELLNEFVKVANQSKFRKYFDEEAVENLLSLIKDKVEFITVTSSTMACRDPKDNFLLALATDGNATHLITGDKDLLVLGNHETTKILTIKEYLASG